MKVMVKLRDALKSSPRSRIIVGALVVVALVLIFVGATFAISSPRACGSCHEMKPKVASWSVSPHAEVGCYSCHGTPRPWYGAPLSMAERWTLVARDMRARQAGLGSQTATGSTNATGSPIPDAACLQCHDANRKATARYGLVIKHAEHAKRNKSCVSCHLWAAHPDPKASRGTLMMAQCFNCHGQAAQPKASADCFVCHVKDIDLKPETHKTGTWTKQHGKAAMADRQQCVMCHKQDFCTGCHGLEMPHPLGWARGASGHAVVAKQDRAACEKCHVGNANLCTMCHHQGFDDKKGPWVAQHNLQVRETGAAFCFKCHEATYCVRCHTSSPVPASTPQ
jgi:nitrate/TMAO reductase-like tetraheme cytochrome c subunit